MKYRHYECLISYKLSDHVIKVYCIRKEGINKLYCHETQINPQTGKSVFYTDYVSIDFIQSVFSICKAYNGTRKIIKQ